MAWVLDLQDVRGALKITHAQHDNRLYVSSKTTPYEYSLLLYMNSFLIQPSLVGGAALRYSAGTTDRFWIWVGYFGFGIIR